MGVHEDLHVGRNLVAAVGPEYEMPVIRHYAKVDDAYDGVLGGFHHAADEADVVLVAAEDLGLLVSAVHDVLGYVVRKNAWAAWHERNALQRSCQPRGHLPRRVAGTLGASHRMRQPPSGRSPLRHVSGWGASGVGQITRVNWPRCKSSRP